MRVQWVAHQADGFLWHLLRDCHAADQCPYFPVASRYWAMIPAGTRPRSLISIPSSDWPKMSSARLLTANEGTTLSTQGIGGSPSKPDAEYSIAVFRLRAAMLLLSSASGNHWMAGSR